MFSNRVVHFTGIKGVGMCSLALAFQDHGWKVQGSDTAEPQITDGVLRVRGIRVFERFTPRNVSTIEKSKWKPVIDRLIYTGAHHGAHNVEVKWAVSRNISVTNYANALGEFFADKKQICVCGVGGKTTTTAMIATILHNASLDPSTEPVLSMPNGLGMTKDPSWVIGTSEVASLPAPGHFGKGEWAVIESDEYVADPFSDRTPKFMYLSPKMIVCTNIEYDHPDVYPTLHDSVVAYERFFQRLPNDGLLLLSSQADEKLRRHGQFFQKMTRDRVSNFVKVFDSDMEGEAAMGVRKVLSTPGEYNVRNALAALSAAESIGINRWNALAALSKFRGSKRRFEHIATVRDIDLYDDYAHHPHEISALVRACRERFPGRKIRFVFQPHTSSRTKVLFDEFVESLSSVDEVVLYPIFTSAREGSDPSISSQMLADAIRRNGGNACFLSSRKKLVEYLCRSARSGDVIMTVGAGNLYDIHDDLTSCLQQTRKAPPNG